MSNVIQFSNPKQTNIRVFVCKNIEETQPFKVLVDQGGKMKSMLQMNHDGLENLIDMLNEAKDKYWELQHGIIAS